MATNKWKRPPLREVDLEGVLSLIGKEGMLIVTMDKGQWDGILQFAYNTWAILLEMGDNGPVKAYQKESNA